MNIILLGPPGVGKGTVGSLLEQTLGIKRFSTGEAFREEMKKDSAFGKKIKSYMDRNELVPDEITLQYLMEQVTKPAHKNGMLLDGVPRTIPQAEYLDAHQFRIDKVLFLNAPDNVIIQRLSSRRTCQDCQTPYNLLTQKPKKEGVCDKCNGALYQRDDDKPEQIKKRLVDYRQKTEPLIVYYTLQEKLIEIDATPSPEVILKKAIAALGYK